MKKGLLILVLSLFADSCFAVMFLENSMDLSTPVVISFGDTIEEAKTRAEAKIPQGFEVAYEQNSPIIECDHADIYWGEKSQCGSSQVRYTLPIRKMNR